jgi:FOG: HEAT repeat
VVAFWPGEREPRYNGKKLSEWIEIDVDGISRRDYSLQAEAVKAIQTMGTNALPCLLKWGWHDAPDWQRRAAEKCKQLGLNWPERWVMEKVRNSQNAWMTMRMLGAKARTGAIPEVSRMALESKSPNVVLNSIQFLSETGPDAVPALLEVFTHGRGERRGQAMHYMSEIPNLGTNGPTVVAVLLQCLGDKNEEMAASAALRLGEVGLQTKEIIPALIARLRDDRRMVRYCASRALGNLANNRAVIPELRQAVPELINAQKDDYPMVREWATNALLKIAPEAMTNGVRGL